MPVIPTFSAAFPDAICCPACLYALRALQPVRRVVPNVRRDLIKPCRPLTDLGPLCLVELEMVRARLRINPRRLHCRRPAQRLPGLKLIQRLLRECQVTPKGRMLRIMVQVIVKDPVRTEQTQHRVAVDQDDRRMLGRRIPVRLAKLLGTSHGHDIAFSGLDVMTAGLVPGA